MTFLLDNTDLTEHIGNISLPALRRIDLITVPPRNQKWQISRQTQLSEQLHIKKNHAHTFWGYARGYTPNSPLIRYAFI